MTSAWAAPAPQLLPPVDQLVVPYAYDRIVGIAAARRSMMFKRVISLCITLLILIGLQIYRFAADISSTLFGWPYWGLLGLSLALSLSFLAVAIVQWRRAEANVAALRPEPVVVLARQGVEIVGQQVPWPMVTGLTARTTRRGDLFDVHRTDGPMLTVAFDLLDAAPSSLDSAARAFSAGRVGVDFSAMDN